MKFFCFDKIKHDFPTLLRDFLENFKNIFQVELKQSGQSNLLEKRVFPIWNEGLK